MGEEEWEERGGRERGRESEGERVEGIESLNLHEHLGSTIVNAFLHIIHLANFELALTETGLLLCVLWHKYIVHVHVHCVHVHVQIHIRNTRSTFSKCDLRDEYH